MSKGRTLCVLSPRFYFSLNPNFSVVTRDSKAEQRGGRLKTSDIIE